MAPKRSASSDRMTQYTYLPRLSTGFAPAFGTAGTVRGDISRMTRDPALPLRGPAFSFLSAVRAGRPRERRGGFGLGGVARGPSPGGSGWLSASTLSLLATPPAGHAWGRKRRSPPAP